MMSTSAMDDPVTPIYIPGTEDQMMNSFDTEFSPQELSDFINNGNNNYYYNNSSSIYSPPLEHESIKDLSMIKPSDMIGSSSPLDSVLFLESTPFDIEEYLQNDHPIVMMEDSWTMPEWPSDHPVVEELNTPVLDDHPIIEMIDKNNQLLALEEMLMSEDPFTIKSNLSLDLEVNKETIIKETIGKVPTTPELIKSLLQDDETTGNEVEVDQVPIVVSSFSFSSTSSSTEETIEVNRKKTSTIKRKRTISSYSSSCNSSAVGSPLTKSDLRRIKNNEASKKSRSNRRQKQMSQSQMVSVLEEDIRRNTLLVNEYEALKAKMMEYITKGAAASNRS